MSRPPARFRLSWPLVLLVGGLACTVLALFEAQRSVRSNQVVAERALTAYAHFAGWSYEEHFSEEMRLAVQEVLGGVNMFHQSPPIPDARQMGHGLTWSDSCQCHAPRYGPLPVAFVGFALGRDTLGVGYEQRAGGDARLAGGHADGADRATAGAGRVRCCRPKVDRLGTHALGAGTTFALGISGIDRASW